ncbi:hypothetical protein ACJ73_01554 [Blastomyces percursus]|uniref:Uncharacterized protein n=1 Tax=Blastomyces percursus TaxID=1658174 RepID=A0A1J9QEZ3_9EURO|nr:hypothetical protein ACJ73_01554 [Blastomyces percursus]
MSCITKGPPSIHVAILQPLPLRDTTYSCDWQYQEWDRFVDLDNHLLLLPGHGKDLFNRIRWIANGINAETVTPISLLLSTHILNPNHTHPEQLRDAVSRANDW